MNSAEFHKTNVELVEELEKLKFKYNSLEHAFEESIAKNKQVRELLEMLIDSSKEFIQHQAGTPDYTKITQTIQKLSGAKFAILNIFDSDRLTFTTVALAGVNKNIKKGISLLGYHLENKKWAHDPIRAERTKDQIITRFENLYDLSGNVIPIKISSLLEKVFNIGETYVVNIKKGDKLFGDFTLLFDKTETLLNHRFVELYVHQVGMFIDRYTESQKVINSENKLRAITDAARDAIIMMDPSGNISYWNPSAENIFGYSRSEACGKNLHLLLTLPQHIQSFQKAYPKFEKTGLGHAIGKTIDFEVFHKDGHPITIQISLSAIQLKEQWHAVGIVRDISLRKKIEAELKNSKIRFETIFTEAPMGIALIDSNTGHILEVNPQFAKITGRTVEEMTTIDWIQITHPDDVQEDLNNMALLNTGKISGFQMEKRYQKPDGTYVWINMTIAPMKNDAWENPKHLCMIEEITKRKQLGETLRKLSQAVEQSPISIIITNPNGIIEYGNPVLTKITGYQIDELIGKNPRIFKSNYKTKEEYKILWETIKSGRKWQGEFLNIKKNGESYWERALISPITDENGKILHFLALKEDITENKLAAETLLESEKKYKNLSLQLEAIIDHIPGFVFYKDNKNNFVRVNKYLANTYNKTKEEIEGKNFSEILNPHIAYKQLTDDLKIIDSGMAKLNVEESWETESGMIWFNTSKIPMIDTNNEVSGLIGISMDITKRKLYEEQILKNNEQLKELIAEKDKFFSIISHDLRSPFSAIVSLLELLAEKSLDYSAAEISSFAISAHKTAKSTFQLLENMLEWSRLKRGVLPFQPKRINISKFILTCDNTILDFAKNKQIEIVFDLPKNLMASGDLNMLHSILRNLMSNAIKFTKEGGTITIKANKHSKQEVLISISDTGIGMDADRLNKLFRIDTNVSRAGTNGEPSTGLGLILCKEFIEKHGGHIWAKSELDKGSCFYFTLPK